MNSNGSESLVKSIYGSDNNVEFLDYEVKTGGKFRLAIYQKDINQQTDYIGLSYTLIDNIIGGSRSGGTECIDNIAIAPSDYGFADAYPTTDTTKQHILSNGFEFSTTRYRTGFIQGEYIVMSPFRKNITKAYIEYKFNVPISQIEVDLTHWRLLSNEWTYSSNCTAELRTESGYKLDLLSAEMNLPTDRTQPTTYTIVFDQPVYSFGFYMKSKRINTNDNNRGRLCIGNMKVYTTEGWY